MVNFMVDFMVNLWSIYGQFIVNLWPISWSIYDLLLNYKKLQTIHIFIYNIKLIFKIKTFIVFLNTLYYKMYYPVIIFENRY
jgi:hypothetical protein